MAPKLVVLPLKIAVVDIVDVGYVIVGDTPQIVARAVVIHYEINEKAVSPILLSLN